MAGGYSPWDWMTGRPWVDAAGNIVGQMDGNVGRNRGMGYDQAYIKNMDPVNGLVDPKQVADKANAPARAQRMQEQRQRDYNENVAIPRQASQNALDDASSGILPDGTMGTKTYQNKGAGGYGDGPGTPRDPFKPLPGMQHNPDPNRDPFQGGGSQGGGAATGFGGGGPLLDLIKGYEAARLGGMTKDQALTHLHYNPPQRPQGGQATGSGGQSSGSGGSVRDGLDENSPTPYTSNGMDPNKDDWRRNSTPYTERSGPFGIFSQYHPYPAAELETQYLRDNSNITGENSNSTIRQAEESLRKKRDLHVDQQNKTKAAGKVASKQRDDKPNKPERLKVDR